jgi:hypothetical protein
MLQSNPYDTQDLWMPASVHRHLETLQGPSETELRPFRRQIDLWWAGLMVGLRIESTRPHNAEADKQRKFNTGAILSTDPWRVQYLNLLALAKGGTAMLDSPTTTMNLAHEHANAGLDWLMEEILGKGDTILAMNNAVRSLV